MQNMSVQKFVLTTVSFRETPATFLSVRILYQLGRDAAEKLEKECFLDNFLSGADTKAEETLLIE